MPQEGLRRLFRRVWARKAARWRRSARRRTGNQVDADDVLQEAIVRTLRADPNVKNTHEIDSYVLSAVRAVANDRHKALGVQRRLGLAVTLEVNAGPSPLEEAVRVEEAEYRVLGKALVVRGLARLEPELRQTIELSYLHRPPLKLHEIAEIQAVSVATVQRRRQKALKMLAKTVAWRPE